MTKKEKFVAERKNLTKVLVVFLSVFFSGNQLSVAQDSRKEGGSLLWEISGNGLSRVSYLFGTVHVYDTNIFKLPKSLFSKLEKCNTLVLELDFGEINRMALMNKMFITSEDSTLDKLMKPEAYAKLLQMPFAKLFPEEQIQKFKPIMLVSLLLMDESMTDMLSVDMQLYEYALKEGKKIIGLETMEEQINAVDAVPLQEQVKMVESFLEMEIPPKEVLGELLKAYKDQDFEQIEEMENKSSNALFSEKIGAERNIVMAQRIDQLFASDKKSSLFIGVGALHINSMDNMQGIVDLLRAKGYTLKPLHLKFE